ncbi:MAG TPA: hypothetical protein VNO30_17125 [Kofleriaceae bacterium]|nr:hypothetical protein [Kofleriaceae bacterium]
MRETPSAVRFLAGVLAGVALVLACSDDSPGNVDAGTCDCPAAEPPISGRVVIVNSTVVIAGGSSNGESAVCPQGAQLLSGSCTTPDINPLRDVTLQQSGFYQSVTAVAWRCEVKNNEATPVTIKVSAICLMPSS